jgi:hypothetical protein
VFKEIRGRIALAAGLALAVGLLIAGCGGGSSTASEQELAKAERHGRIERAEKEKERKLEQKLEKLEQENRQAKKRHRDKERQELKEDVSPPSSGSTSPAPSGPSGTDCGGGTIAGPETSCGFALDTRTEYEAYVHSGSGDVEAWSEANHKWYDMYCTEGSEHECSGAISATVYWP